MYRFVLLFLLACAAQGLAAELPVPAERFVPHAAGELSGPRGTPVNVQMRTEAATAGEAITIAHVLRWSDADKPAMDPLGELVIARFTAGTPFRSISIEEVKATLQGAGANAAFVQFGGAMSCTVTRSDTPIDEGKALQQWEDAKDNATGAKPNAAPSTRNSPTTHPADEPAPPRNLRDLLTGDLAERLSLPVESLQIRFNPQDEKLLRLVESQFRFGIEPRRVRNLGDVAWDVTIFTEGGKQKAPINAYARAWQQQVVTLKPLAYQQMIRDEDVIERRTLTDHLPDDPLALKTAIVSQQAGRDLTAGTVLTTRMITAVPLVKTGQLVTITVESGRVQVKTVAEARETGVFGQTIRVRKPSTQDEFFVVVSGPQTAKAVAGGL